MYFRAFGPLEDVFTMVYLDSRGSGRSEAPADSAAYAYADFVADLDALRQHLGQEKVWLMGQSEGGVQVQHYAVAHGDRIAGLVLVDTLPASDADWVSDVRARVHARKGEPYYEAAAPLMLAAFAGDEKGWKGFDVDRLGMSFPEMWEHTMPFSMSDFRRLEEISARMMSQGSHQEVAHPPEGFSAAALQGMKDSGRHPFNLVEQLKHVQAPTLMVTGADDVLASPASAERLHLALTTSKLLAIEDAGHFPWVEQPEAFFGGIKRLLARLGCGAK